MKKWIVRVCIVTAACISAAAWGAKPQVQTKQVQADAVIPASTIICQIPRRPRVYASKNLANETAHEYRNREAAGSIQKAEDAQDVRDRGKKAARTALKRMFMYRKKLYVETGETNSMPRCGVMDGQITASVAADKKPKKNGQSNFGKGYGFQFGCRKNRIEVCIDGTWHVFAYNENNLEGVSIEAVKNTSSKAVLKIRNTTEKQVVYGEDFVLEMQNKKTGEWEIIPMKDGYGFHDIAYNAPENKAVKWKVNWRGSHGKLKPGNYRIVKSFMDFRGTGDYTEYILSAEFQV